MGGMDHSLLWHGALVLVGLAAGFVNTLAGGGSLLTLPLLLLAGLPPHIANGTNRVAVFLQSVAGTMAFDREGVLDRGPILALSAPTLVGSLVGAGAAVVLPARILEPALLGAMLLVAMALVLFPSAIAPPPGESVRSISEVRGAWAAFFGIGFYGGFAQAGVGFFLLAALGGLLRYDLARSNALKLLLVTTFTGLALVVFILADQVWWIPGLALSVGTVAGSRLGVRFAIEARQDLLRWVIVAIVVASCLGIWFR